MKKFYLRWLPPMLALSLLVACGTSPAAPPASDAPAGNESADAAPVAAQPNIVTAVKVDAVTLDSAAAYWGGAPLLSLETKSPVEEAKAGPPVSVQAVYDDQSIAMRFAWDDASESVLKHAWTWDGSKFSSANDEDRVQLLWPIGNIAEFSSKGCAGACHNMAANQEEWYMATESADQRYDLWHWKSARTNPVGQSDDQWIGLLEDPTNMESSRHGDAKESGGYKDNLNETEDGPAFMHKSDPAAKFIMAGEEIAIDTSKLASGAVIPGFLIAPAVGSRGDVTANGVWSDGKWVVVLMRSLDPAHDDDVSFTPPKPYSFGLAVTDNGGGTDHLVAPEAITLEWQ